MPLCGRGAQKMMLRPALLAVMLGAANGASAGTPRMLGIFGDSMVLQHDEPLIHGCGAAPHARIAALVSPGPTGSSDEVVRRVADQIGCFQLPLAARPAMTATSGGVSIAVKVSVGNASSPFFARADRVLYGTQILCGGQSNMVHQLNYDYNATQQIAAAVHLPALRLLQVGRQWSNGNGATLPLACHSNGTSPPIRGFGCDPNGNGCAPHNVWRDAAHEATLNGSAAAFSAVCYLTAQELMRTELGVDAAVGLVEADWGGSNEAPWQSRAVAVARGCPAMADRTDGCPLATTSGLSPITGDNWGCLYRGMIEPLTRSLRPALSLWYQGESNSNDPPDAYQCQLEALVVEWRVAFNRSTMPFFAVQLAPYWEPPCEPPPKNVTPCGIGDHYPAIRIAQANAMALLEAETGAPSGVCITHDIGDMAGGIHPHNKSEVGRRLALEIRAKVFKADGLPRIPTPEDPIGYSPRADEPLLIRFLAGGRHDANLTLSWKGTHNCSVCCASSTAVVEVCSTGLGCENQTSPAWRMVSAAWDAPAGGLRLQAVSPVPTAVRYAWSNFPQCVLFDQHALPVGPFNLSVEVV